MEYIKGNPYFCFSQKQIKQYPYLKEDLECEILTIGGGIDGAILNYYLSKNNYVVLVDKSRLGYACTSCATELLEYQLDEFSFDLNKYLSNKDVVFAYQMALNAMDKIESFIKECGNHCEYTKRPTFLYSNEKASVKDLSNEYKFRKSYGFDCEFYTKMNNPFPFKIEAGIYDQCGGCEFNPYLFTKQMIENSKNQDKIFENT